LAPVHGGRSRRPRRRPTKLGLDPPLIDVRSLIPFEQITTAGVATYLHADQLGSIRMITNTTGTNAGTASYTAYGTRTTTGTTSAFGYAGQYTDTETGLQWDRARYYDPTTAQFLTVDPLAAATGARYSYASGNPITGADPTGLIDWGQVGTFAVVGLVIVGTAACVIAEPCGAIEGGLGLALAGGGSTMALTVSAEAAATATTAAIAGGGIFGSLDIMAQNANDGNNGSDCPASDGAEAGPAGGGLSPAASRQLGNLAGRADDTLADVIRTRGGGAGQINQLQSGYGQLTLRKVAELAARGDAQAVKALKMAKQAGSQGKGGK
jgi:RHS repeat-associated protein